VRVLSVAEDANRSAWRFMVGLDRALGRAGARHRLVTLQPRRPRDADTSASEVDCTHLGLRRFYWRAIPRLARLIDEFEPDIVHAHQWVVAARVTAALRRTRRAPRLVYTRHHSRTLEGRAARMDEESVEAADLVVSVSESQQRKLLELRPELGAKCRVVPNGIDLTEASGPIGNDAVVGALPRGGDAHLLLLGRLHPVKRHDLALEAVRILRDQGRDVRVAFVGEGPARHTIESQREELGLADVVRMPGQAHDIAGVMAWADLAWVPSDRESFGLVVVEAMAAGVPVVASSAEALQELIEDGTTGRLVPVGDDEALARVTAELLDDPAERERLARNAQRVSEERWSAEAAARRHLDLYRELLGEGAA